MNAPLIPGREAAGLHIGEPIAPILQEMGDVFSAVDNTNPYAETHMHRFNSVMVDLCEEDGVITQIMVHDGYRGTYAGVIGLGSTLFDVERFIGPWFEDEVDEFEIQGIAGMCFEIENYLQLADSDPAFRYAPILHICIFYVPSKHESRTIP